MTDTLLEVRRATKRFPGNTALDHVSLKVGRGEIVALLGHNGSGKSTLVKVLSGIYELDGGHVWLGDDRKTSLHFIHQNLGLIPSLTVIENLDLGKLHHAAGLGPFRHRTEREHVTQLVREFGGDFDVDRPVATLTPAQQTIVAIARAFDGWSDGNNVLVLDEPTAALHGDEVHVLQDAVRVVAARGAGVVYISHRLGEVVELADRVIVLKNGRVVARRDRGDFDREMLVAIIAGGEVPAELATREPTVGAELLRVTGLRGPGLAGASFSARAGEVVGISGLVGSGMEQITGAIFGATPVTAGEVVVDGTVIPPGSPNASIRAGLAFVPADRRVRGAVGMFPARENITLPRLAPLRQRWGTIDLKRERTEVGDWMNRVNVLPAGFAEQRFDLFSGGNQQKIVLAKWLRLAPRVILLDEPTQGVDAGAQAEIYELLVAAAAGGATVIVSSSDTKELATVCDRVLVMRDGVIAEEFTHDRLSESALVRAVVDDSTSPNESRTA